MQGSTWYAESCDSPPAPATRPLKAPAVSRMTPADEKRFVRDIVAPPYYLARCRFCWDRTTPPIKRTKAPTHAAAESASHWAAKSLRAFLSLVWEFLTITSQPSAIRPF